MNHEETVFLVDADDDERHRICELVTGMQISCSAFASAQEFLESFQPYRSGCVILEVRIPDGSGLQLQEQLVKYSPSIPIIFHSAFANAPVIVRAIKNGAVNFLEKPADDQDLWEAIQEALQIDRHQRAEAEEYADFQQKMEQLTDKEIQVLELLAQDKTTRTIARQLNISVRTVEFRRARMLKKLEFGTPMQLSHFAIRVFDGHPVQLPGQRRAK
jgi:two-component system response regulator FixJ